ncbi:MAG: hypothetical protein FWE85_04575 [Clostridiales bacterium]|nr:hypothetical protein [Clostridiales bacterium]
MSARLLEALARPVAKEQAAHAYLLCGENGFEQALLLAMALNCLSSAADGQPCGECPSCHKIARLNHADLTVVEPEGNYLRVEQLRKLQSKLHWQKFEGRCKTVIIKNSEAMKEEAANSLLKILEDPPADTVFILLAQTTDKILPTVLSRCQAVNAGASGSFALSEERLRELLPQAAELLNSLPQMRIYQVLGRAASWEKDREGALHLLAAILRILHASLSAPFAGEAREAPARLPAIQPKTLLTTALLAEECLREIHKNANLRLSLDVFFLRLWSALKRASPATR